MSSVESPALLGNGPSDDRGGRTAGQTRATARMTIARSVGRFIQRECGFFQDIEEVKHGVS